MIITRNLLHRMLAQVEGKKSQIKYGDIKELWARLAEIQAVYELFIGDTRKNHGGVYDVLRADVDKAKLKIKKAKAKALIQAARGK